MKKALMIIGIIILTIVGIMGLLFLIVGISEVQADMAVFGGVIVAVCTPLIIKISSSKQPSQTQQVPKEKLLKPKWQRTNVTMTQPSLDSTQRYKNIKNIAENIKLPTHQVCVVGTRYECNGNNPQPLIRMLREYDQVILRLDKSNKYDRTAIEVLSTRGEHLGWFAKDDNSKAFFISSVENNAAYIAWVHNIYKMDMYPDNVGLVIKFAVNNITSRLSDSTNLDSFPERDEKGKKALTLRETKLDGTERVYNGIVAQDVINTLRVGDNVILKNSPTAYEVNVFSKEMKQFGTLPEWQSTYEPKIKEEVFTKLEDGATVLSKVKNVYKKGNGRKGVIISICRYRV